MKRYFYSLMCKGICLVILCGITLPSQAFLWWGDKDSSTLENISRQVIAGESLAFTTGDFYGSENWTYLQIASLPSPDYGLLVLGDQVLKVDEIIEYSAISGLSFRSNQKIGSTEFAMNPGFLGGSKGDPFTVSLHILETPNQAPTAKDMDLSTYKNIQITAYFDAVDGEGDPLTYQIVDPPARGALILAEDGSSSFLYTPYENKTGKDSFRYTATDTAGNISHEATVTVRIEKANTPVLYGDLEGHSAHKSAIRLAEKGIFVGECVGNTYLFHPDETVSREEFLSLAMAVSGLEPLTDVTLTGFYDDTAIQTWSKGYISSALLAGVIQGSWDQSGRPVFNPEDNITQGEAVVILNNLLEVAQIEASEPHWASQASASLSAAGIVGQNAAPLPQGLTRSQVAELLDEALTATEGGSSKWKFW